MSKNAYAAKLMKAKAALSAQERRELIGRTFETTYKLAVIANNRAFGKGRESAKLFRDTLNDLFTEYDQLMKEVDTDYADGKVDEAYRAIVGEGLEQD